MSVSDPETEISDVDSFGTVEERIATLKHLISELYGEAEELEAHLGDLHLPLEKLELAQLGDVPFLQSSPFRTATFQVKPPGFPGADLSRRYAFHEICAVLRAYLYSSGAVAPDGTITLSKQLKSLFGVQSEKVTYIELLGHLRSVLI